MNVFLQILFRGFANLPYIIAGIQQLHGDLPGATKKQIALDALGLAKVGAQIADPQQQAAIEAATKTASAAIDGTVETLKAAGVIKKQ